MPGATVLVEMADHALYEANVAGPNRVVAAGLGEELPRQRRPLRDAKYCRPCETQDTCNTLRLRAKLPPYPPAAL